MQIEIADINIPLLKEQLNAALGYAAPFRVVQNIGEAATVIIEDGALSPGDKTAIQDVLAAHDPAQLTTYQAATQAAQGRLEWARSLLAKLDTSKDLTARADFPDIIKALVIAARGG
jgi:hypothetical protein